MLKSRDITLPIKIRLVKAMVFPVVMYGCESWTTKKAECWRIDAFELWCWRRLLIVPWTSRRSNQSILKEVSPQFSLEGLMLKLKLQYFGHLMWRIDSLEKTLMLGKTEAGRRRGRQRMRWLDGITDVTDMSLSRLREVGNGQGGLAICSPWGYKESDTTELLDWTELSWWYIHTVGNCEAIKKKKKRGRVPWNDLEGLPAYIVKSKKAKCKGVSIACCLSCEKEESIRIYMGLLTSARRNTGRMNPKTNI